MMYKIKNDSTEVWINSLGAELWSIKDMKTQKEFLWQGEKEIWPRRAPMLFPICGRLTDNTANIDGKSYEILLHGFARDYEHKVIYGTEDLIMFSFTSNEETKERYPFDFELITTFSLKGDELIHSFEVINNSGRVMPFSIGYHTGYQCPLGENSKASDCVLKFEKKENLVRLLCDENGYLTGETTKFLEEDTTIPLSHKEFPGTVLLSGMTSEYVELVDPKYEKKIRIKIKGFPYLALWVNKAEIPFVCIEPWHGLPDGIEEKVSFDKKAGINQLKAGACFTCSQSFALV